MDEDRLKESSVLIQKCKSWRSTVIAFFVLMVAGAIAGCSVDTEHSAGDHSGDPVPAMRTPKSVSTPAPSVSSTPNVVETAAPIEDVSELPIVSSAVSSDDSDELQIEEAKIQLIPLLPEGWHVMEDDDGILPPTVAIGDLNADGIPDVAAVIERNEDPECECAPRSLLLAFGRQDNTLELSIISDEVVLAADEGGVYGDPFDGIVIERGTLLVSDYGGSNWRWYNRLRFRYQDEAWCLIGYTTGSYFTGTTEYEDADEEDYNLLTGDYIIRQTNEEGEVITTKGNRGRKELVKLGEFDMSKM